MGRLLFSLVAMVIGMTTIIAGSTASADELPPALVTFKSERADMARQLASTIAVCVQKHDTAHPAFHGCIDWHSAVHGAWALTAYSNATGDTQYDALLRGILTPEAIRQERDALRADADFEMPYGRAWFLRLSLAHRMKFKDEAFDDMAMDIAQSLVAYYSKIEPDPASLAYDNATWALINLYDFADARGDLKLMGFVREKVNDHYIVNGACPYREREVESGEFMALCSNWAWLVSKVMPHDEFLRWIAVFMPPDALAKPVTKLSSVHQSGLNFSRSWGLWAMYWQTKDTRYLDAYLAHLHETYDAPAKWKGGYKTVGHWVPQFGMMGLMVSYRDLP